MRESSKMVIEIDTNAFASFKAQAVELREGQEINLETTLQVAIMGEVIVVEKPDPSIISPGFIKLFKLKPHKTNKKD